MIVNRRTFIVKRGCMQDVVKMMKEEQKRLNVPTTFRVYTSSIAPFGQVAAEWEYESLAEYEKSWADWSASSESAAFMEKWYKVTESGGTNEIWNLE